jgi:heptaprenyl diphosphate synthase
MLGVLVSLAVALHLAEAQIPTPLPWVRLGLANLVTLLALFELGWRDALLVAVLRVLVGSLLLGGFLGPAFLLALAGAVASVAVMAPMRRGAWLLWSPLAVSVAGAVAHGCAQLLVLSWLLLRTREALLLAPWVLLPGAAAGTATGVLANIVLLRRGGGLARVAS